MFRVLRPLVVLSALFAVLVCAPSAFAAKWDTKLLALVPSPGFPAHAYSVPGSEKVYEGTYDNPLGDMLASKVFEFDAHNGELGRSWTIKDQTLSSAHGVQVATSDARGRLVLLDKAPARVLLLDRTTGEQTVYAQFPSGAVPNYAAWGPDGSLYVTDYEHPVLWRVPPGGGTPVQWFTDKALDGMTFGTTGLELRADKSSLLIGQQSEAGLSAGNPTTGRLFTLAINADGSPGKLTPFWESGTLDAPDGFAIAASGNVYVALLLSNQLVELGPDGKEHGRFPAKPGTGATGAEVPFDAPSSAVYSIGNHIVVANQSYVTGTAAHQAVLDVDTGEPGLTELIPRNAGLKDAVAPRITEAKFRRRTLRFRIDEPATVKLSVTRAGKRVRVRTKTLGAGRFAYSLRGLAGKRLAHGRWRVAISATDAAGNRSTTVRRGVSVR